MEGVNEAFFIQERRPQNRPLNTSFENNAEKKKKEKKKKKGVPVVAQWK